MAADGFNQDIDMARRQLDALDKAIPAVLPEASLAAAELMLPVAEAMAPRRTHELAGSGSVVPLESDNVQASAAVRFSAFYAQFQEFGTGHHAANPFLRPAAEQERRRMGQAVQDVVNSAVSSSLIEFGSRMKRR